MVADLVSSEPAQRLADRLVTLRSLTPPVDVRSIIGEMAEIVEVDVPAHIDADAIAVIDPTVASGSKILLNSRRPDSRQRFTLAHELGHIMIPWHLGTIACSVSHESPSDSDAYTALEREANMFASRLLIPRAWLASIVATAPDMATILRGLEQAEVSAPAGLLALKDSLPTGYVVALVNQLGRIESSFRSSGTLADPPAVGSNLRETRMLNEIAAESGRTEHRGRMVAWWRFEETTTLGRPRELSPHRMKLELKRMQGEMLGRAGLLDRQASFSGVVGFANTAAGDAYEQIGSAIVQRIAAHPEFAPVLSDPDFSEWLTLKAAVFASRPAQRRSRE